MVIKNYRDIKKQADSALRANPHNSTKTALLFGGVPVALTLLLSFMSLILNNAESSSGLDGIQTYGVLSTVFSTLDLACGIFQLFWAPGILFCGLLIMQGQNPYPSGLFQGFRKWKPLVRYMILLSIPIFLLYMFLTVGVSTVVVTIWLYITALTGGLPQTEAEMVAYIESLSTSPTMNTLAVIVAVISIVVIMLLYIPLSYRLRAVNLLIMDQPQMGARRAIATSFRITKGSCLQLFLIDLSFWWYYLLIGAASCIPFLSALPLFSRWDSSRVNIVLTLISCAATLGVYLLGIVRLNTTQAAAYCHMISTEDDHDI